jgi:hypothetical protein
MKDIEQVPSMGVIHLIAIKDNHISDLKRKVEEMQKTLEWYADLGNYFATTLGRVSETDADKGERARQTIQSLKEDKPNGNSTTV